MGVEREARERARAGLTVSPYYELDYVADRVEKGKHRAVIGGAWDEIGLLQFEYLRDHGLEPGMRLLDVGCGSLRGGVHFAGYLEPGNYYGLDISQELLDAGWEFELGPLGLQDRVPRSNLVASGDFEAASFGVEFDVLLAQSLFTHLTSNLIRMCMSRMAKVTAPGARFFATVFIVPAEVDPWEPFDQPPAGITTYPTVNPYHYREVDVTYWAEQLPWRLEAIEDWGHPRGQKMAVYTRTDD